MLARLFKNQQKEIAGLKSQTLEQERLLKAVGVKKKKKKDTGYFASRGQLLSLIIEHFNTDDLENICFDLGVPYDSIPGIGKRAKAQSIIEYFENRIEMYKLLDVLQLERPHVEWPSI